MSFTVPSSVYRARPRSAAVAAVFMYLAAGLLLLSGLVVLLDLAGGRGGTNGPALLLLVSVAAAVGEFLLAGRIWQGVAGAHRWAMALNLSAWLLFGVVACVNTIGGGSDGRTAAPAMWAQTALVGLTLATDLVLVVVIAVLALVEPYEVDIRPG